MINDKFGTPIVSGSIVLSANKSYGSVYFCIGVIQEVSEETNTRGTYTHTTYKIRNKKFEIRRGWDSVARQYTDEYTVSSRSVCMRRPSMMVVIQENFFDGSDINPLLREAILTEVRRIHQV